MRGEGYSTPVRNGGVSSSRSRFRAGCGGLSGRRTGLLVGLGARRLVAVSLPHVEAVGTTTMSTALAGEPVSQAQVNGLVEEVLPQGCWSDDDYLWLTDHTRRLVEFTDGYLEILPVPSRGHQRILAFLYSTFHAFLVPGGGEVLLAPLRLRIRQGKFREPDLLLVRDSRDPRSGERFWTGADVVVEVVSPDNSKRHLVLKHADYAEAAIPEYWIVDPSDETITVLALEDAGYVEHGVYDRRTRAVSPILPGFAVDIGDVFEAAGGE